MVFVDRRRRAESYPWLVWKVRLFVAGAVLAVAGMALEMRWLLGIATAFLVTAFLLRILPGGQGLEVEDGDPYGDAGE